MVLYYFRRILLWYAPGFMNKQCIVLHRKTLRTSKIMHPFLKLLLSSFVQVNGKIYCFVCIIIGYLKYIQLFRAIRERNRNVVKDIINAY